MLNKQRLALGLAIASFLLTLSLHGQQVSPVDYDRAASLRNKYRGLALNVPDSPTWVRGKDKFIYRKSVEGGSQFVLVDADAGTKNPAFDHDKLAAVLSTASGEKYTGVTLPFQRFQLNEEGTSISFSLQAARWSCDLVKYTCTKAEGGPGGRGVPDMSMRFRGSDAGPGGRQRPQFSASPDGKWEAYINNYNVYLREKGKRDTGYPLSLDGSEGNYFGLESLRWSPDSKRLLAVRIRPAGYHREVHYIESSPADQLQPKHTVIEYAKPGDVLDLPQPVLFDIATKRETVIDNTLFPNPYELNRFSWWKDSRAFTFEYNQRGHQVYRVIEVNAETGVPRALISEEPKTFIDYPRLIPSNTDSGKVYRYDVNDGKEVIWMSERDGWAHLYLFDGVTGKLKNQITKGNWVVRGVDKVDEEKRQIWFEGAGMYSGKDPYFLHAMRVNFDGSGMTTLTSEPDANHQVVYSADMKYFVDTYSRVDLPPTMELRRTADKSLVMTVEKADISKLVAAGWKAPEVFSAIGRDGKTDIWGIIFRPANFDPSKKYPVIEYIYAGPQGSFVPKTFSAAVQPLTELGFVVVQCDGMGTNNRSKAFHDISWKNLKDGGFEDRILWHKTIAAKYPWYDISRVGIFGTSAGGQNAMAAVLFHPEFYKAAVANSGSHDNRMDKIWWNELWMSWPIGPQYAASSNVDNAYRLQGKLMIVVGEMDNNVDPATQYQVANALEKANKDFDFLVIPGGGHGAGGAYGQRKLQDFFVHNLLGTEPPAWNAMQNQKPLGTVREGN